VYNAELTGLTSVISTANTPIYQTKEHNTSHNYNLNLHQIIYNIMFDILKLK